MSEASRLHHWTKVKVEAVFGGSDAQAINVFEDALTDLLWAWAYIIALEAERDERLTIEQVDARDKIIAAEAYARGLERAAEIAEGWGVNAAGDCYKSNGDGRFWTEGTIYDQARVDLAFAIRSELTRHQLPDGEAKPAAKAE